MNERAFVALSLVFSGILAGSPFIVAGQVLLIFLDQRHLLARIERRLRGRRPSGRARPPRPS